MTSGAESTAGPDLPAQILGGRFRVDHPLGRGGMATVFAGWQVAVERPVAIKVVRTDRVQQSWAVDALVDEARRASTVQHPHVVTILDCAHLEDGRPVIVMERLSGQSWSAWVRSEGPPVQTILVCVRQVCAGLQAIHDAGLLHGDLGPRNVFVREVAGIGPWATLLDFGISRALGTVSGDRIWGTPGSMAPELWDGVAVDERTDLWALGVLLHDALTHRLPFPPAPDGLAAMRAGPDLALLAGRADLPAGLRELLSSLLAPHPSDRPPSAAAVVRALDALEPLHAQPRLRPVVQSRGDVLPTGHVVSRVLHRRGRWTEVQAHRGGTSAEVCLFHTSEDHPVGALWLAVARNLQPLVGRTVPPSLQPVVCAEFFGPTLCIVHGEHPGERLSARLAREGPVPWRTVLRWGRQLAEALGVLHAAGTVHGWVHPSSVRVTGNGAQVVLVGAGRRALAELGVPAIAPEVLALTGLDPSHASGRTTGPASDWSALGNTLLGAIYGDGVVTSAPEARPRPAPEDVPIAVRELLERLASQDMARTLDGVEAVVASLDAVLADPLGPGATLRRSLDAPGPLVGRAGALDLLRGALDDARDGAGSVWWLKGPSGAGRSRLLDTLVPLARGLGVRVWRVHAPSPSRGGIARLAVELAHHVDSVPPEVAARLRDRVARAIRPHVAVLAPVSPVFARLADVVAPERVARPDPRALAVAHSRALTDLLTAVCPPEGAPAICLLVDDFEQMDDGMGAFLSRLPLHVESLRLLCVVATGSAALSRARSDDLRVAERNGALDYTLPPLTSAEVERLLATHVGDGPAAQITAGVVALSGGWPGPALAVVRKALSDGALVRAGARYVVDRTRWTQLDLHPDLERSLRARIDARSPQCRGVLAAASVWGRGAPAHVLTALTQLAPTEVVGAAMEAVQAGLLRADADGWRLAHTRLDAIACASVAHPEQFHRRAAALVAGGDPEDLLRQAHHMRHAPWSPEDRLPLVAACQHLLAEGRPTQALQILDHLVAHVSDPSLRVLRAYAARQQGDEGAAVVDLQLAWESASVREVPAQLVAVARTLSDALFSLGRASEADTMLQQTLAMFGVSRVPAHLSAPGLLWLVFSQLIVAPGRLSPARTPSDAAGRYVGPLLGALARVRLLEDPRASFCLGLSGVQQARHHGDRDNMSRALAGFSSLVVQAKGWTALAGRLLRASTALAPDAPEVHVYLETARLDGLYAEGRLDALGERLAKVTSQFLAMGTRVQLVQLAHARHRVATHRGHIADQLANIIELTHLIEDAPTAGPAGWMGELLFMRTCADVGWWQVALELMDARQDVFLRGEAADRASTLWGRALQVARIGVLARLGRTDEALRAWTVLTPEPRGSLRIHAADWTTASLANWAESPSAGSIPQSLWRQATRLARPYPIYRLRLAAARHDAAVRVGRMGAATRAVRAALPLAREVGGRPGAAVLGRAAVRAGGRPAPEGRVLLDSALAQVRAAESALPDVAWLHQLAGNASGALPELPWAVAARGLGLGRLWETVVAQVGGGATGQARSVSEGGSALDRPTLRA